MASIRTLKNRIKTTKNISKITRAMEMVAASKMRKAQETALSGRLYSDELSKILASLASNIKSDLHPLLSSGNQNGRVEMVVISTNKGLCGSLNTNLFIQTEKFISNKKNDHAVSIVAVGKKIRDYTASRGYKLTASFTEIGDKPISVDARPISDLVINSFLNKLVSEVWIVYPKFISTLVQKTEVFKLLPLKISSPENTNLQHVAPTSDYLFEPNPGSVLDQLLPFYIENKLYQLLLESKASEQSARMVAMKNAHDNAKELSSDLNLSYNRLRQSRVTNELLDAISSRMALG